ncbi:VOC family protein [Kitasatospora sp. NPDC048407]|uniref:VOC family protein n=1 Tax=Kitasatospora sp. NPDC048407 TaxID=3364051 RepID=UPI00371EBDC1
MAATLGTAPAPAGAPHADTGMFVCRVADVDAAYAFCLANGAASVLPPIDRPEWGPTLRSAHLRDPQGTLIALQSY